MARQEKCKQKNSSLPSSFSDLLSLPPGVCCICILHRPHLPHPQHAQPQKATFSQHQQDNSLKDIVPEGWVGVWLSSCKLLHQYIGWLNTKVLLYSTGNYIQYPVINQNGREYEKVYVYMYNWTTLLYSKH